MVRQAQVDRGHPQGGGLRQAEAERTKNIIAKIDKDMAEVRKAAAKETAKSLHNIDDEVKAEYMDHQKAIDDLRKRGQDRGDQATIDAANKLQSDLKKQIGIIIAAKKKEKAELEGKSARSFPLRFVDGAVFLGPIKVGDTLPLF